MDTYSSSDIRNVAVVGHGSCGKTILSDSMLFLGKEINRIGTVEEGTTVSDYHSEEIERQISIGLSTLYCTWLGKKFNILDTPGFFDFIGETLSGLHVADMALIGVHGVTGIEPGTERVWNLANQYKLPKLVAVNMMDKENTSFDRIVADFKKKFSKKIFPLQFPINAGPGFNQVADVLRKKMLTYDPTGSGKYQESPLPEDWQMKIDELHQQLIENIAESDDTLMERFFSQGGLAEDELRGGMIHAIIHENVIPLVAVSALSSVGMARLMDIIAKYYPSPVDSDYLTARGFAVNANGASSELSSKHGQECLFVYKTLSESHVGEMSFFRIYSGTIRAGIDLRNLTRGSHERLGQIYLINGKQRREVGELQTGDFGAVVKLKNTHTGDVLSHPKLETERLKKLFLGGINFPAPTIHAAVLAKSKGDEEKLAIGFSALHQEDPTFIYRSDPELKQTLISGQGELHLEVLVSKLKRRYHVDIELIEPRIPYRETIHGKGESKYRHKKQTGGAGQFAEVWMRVEPLLRGSGVEFTESLVGQNVDRVFVPSVEKGVRAASEEGVLAGYKVMDVKVDFYDGKMHPVDSKDIAFQIAGKEAFKEAFQSARPYLLEPIYEIEVKVPEEYMGAVMGDISGRRGKILGMESDGVYQVIRAQAPQANLYRYSTNLRALTGGRATHQEKFSHYEELPKEIEKKVIEQSKKKIQE